jgi:replicative DNA helicase
MATPVGHAHHNKSDTNAPLKVPNTGLPHAKDSELAIIGTILSTPSSIYAVADKLNAEYFFDPSHKLIITAICQLVLENKPPDISLVYNKLKTEGQNLKVGDLEGLRRFLEFNGRPEFLGFWLEEVKRYWELRLVIETCADIASRGKRLEGADVREFLGQVESTFLKLSQERIESGLKPASSVVKETILKLEELFNNPGKITGVPSGFVDLDKLTSGFQPSDLIILAARPAMGKTSLALNLAAHAVFACKKRVAFFSLEMSNLQLMQRLLATSSKIESHKFRNGK